MTVQSNKTIQVQLKTEELLMFFATLILYPSLNYSWWWFAALILVPDIGMIGYLFNTQMGAITYNITHHKGIALVVGLFGYFSGSYPLMLAGLIMFSHASMDRIFGFGLKFPDSFKHTHLGQLK